MEMYDVLLILIGWLLGLVNFLGLYLLAQIVSRRDPKND